MFHSHRALAPTPARSRWAPRFPVPPRTRLGDYEVLDRIGGGGMAEVFLARRVGGARRVAIKRVLRQFAGEREFGDMLIDEARIMALLGHPNIVQFHELSEHEGCPFIVMEHVEGPSLLELNRRLYFRRERVRPPTAALLVASLCDALDHVHSRRSALGRPCRIVHRDVNPANLLLSFAGEVKLCDFGIARAARRVHTTQTGGIKGKYSYMSPEQAQGCMVDARTDIFAAGLVLYELLTGRNPLQSETEIEVIERARLGRVPPPSALVAGLPSSLEAICLRALAPEPARRFQRAGEMTQALDRYLREYPVSQASFASWIRRTCPPRVARSSPDEITGSGLTCP